MRHINSRLAADRRVDLGKQCRGQLHEADPAAKDTSGKAGKIADHAAAQGDDGIAPLDTKGEQSFADFGEHQ